MWSPLLCLYYNYWFHQPAISVYQGSCHGRLPVQEAARCLITYWPEYKPLRSSQKEVLSILIHLMEGCCVGNSGFLTDLTTSLFDFSWKDVGVKKKITYNMNCFCSVRSCAGINDFHRTKHSIINLKGDYFIFWDFIIVFIIIFIIIFLL